MFISIVSLFKALLDRINKIGLNPFENSVRSRKDIEYFILFVVVIVNLYAYLFYSFQP